MVDFQTLYALPWGAFLIASFLGVRGVRKGSLSVSGGIAAFLVGFAMMAVPLRTFGVTLIAFYLIGSNATKQGKWKKMVLEDGHTEGGNRNATQVVCNSLAAFVASVVWSAKFVPNSVAATLLAGYIDPQTPYDRDAWCPVARGAGGDNWSRILLFLTLGYVASLFIVACMAYGMRLDTLRAAWETPSRQNWASSLPINPDSSQPGSLFLLEPTVPSRGGA